MIRGRKLVLFVVGIVVVVAALALWAKHDADTKATAYNAQRSKVAAAYKSTVPQLNVSTYIGNGKDDDAAKFASEQSICDKATTLQKQVAKLANTGIQGSIGSFVSSSYRDAKQASDANAALASKVKTYAATCNYFVASTHQNAENAAVSGSAEYRALLDYNDSCPNGCINQPNYAAFAPIWQKMVDIDEKYSALYNSTPCPLTAKSQQPICIGLQQYEKVVAEHSLIYENALKANDRDTVNNEAKYAAVLDAFDQLNATVRKIDPSTKDVNVFFQKVLATQEAAMRSQKV